MPLRGLYACYTGNLCTLVIYGNIVCICTSYVGLRRKWPYVGEKVPYVRKKETVPFGVPFLCHHKLTELFQIEIDAVIYTDQFTCYNK